MQDRVQKSNEFASFEWRPWSTVWNRYSGPWDWYAPEPEWNSTRWYGTTGTRWKVEDAMESQPAPLERPRTMQPSSSSSRGATQPMDAHGASQPVEPTTQDRVQKSNEFASFSTAPAERLPRTTAWKRIVWRALQAMAKRRSLPQARSKQAEDTPFCERDTGGMMIGDWLDHDEATCAFCSSERNRIFEPSIAR